MQHEIKIIDGLKYHRYHIGDCYFMDFQKALSSQSVMLLEVLIEKYEHEEDLKIALEKKGFIIEE